MITTPSTVYIQITSKAPEWFYCIQSANLEDCNTECEVYCNNAFGKEIELCTVQGNNGCILHGDGCDGPFYKCSCSVKCP